MKKERINNKIIFAIASVLLILIIISVILLMQGIQKNKDEKTLTRLTEEFNDDQKKSNGLKGADSYVKDQDGNIIAEHKGEYEIHEEDKSDQEQLKKKAEKVISDFTDDINSCNFNKAYSLLNRTYVDEFNYSLDTFISTYSFNQKITYDITNVKQNDNRDRVIVTSKFSIGNTGNIKFVDFTLYNDGTIADIPIYVSADINKEKIESDVSYKLLKRYETRLGSIFSLEINNNSNIVINIDSMLIKNMDNICNYEIASQDKVIRAYPGQSFRFMIKIPNTYGIDSLVLRYKDIDNSEKEVDIFK